MIIAKKIIAKVQLVPRDGKLFCKHLTVTPDFTKMPLRGKCSKSESKSFFTILRI